MAAPAFALERAPQTDDELWWLVYYLWGVRIPRHAVCPGHVAPFTAFRDAYFRENSLYTESDRAQGKPYVDSIALWWGSRGLSGKSYMLSVLGLTIAHLLGSDVNLLGGSLSQSVNIHKHMQAAMEHEHAPSYMVDVNSSTEIRLTNKAKIRPLTASQRTVRGPHPASLLLDEIDEMDQEIFDAALGQPMPQVNWQGLRLRPYTVACSTWQNPQGTFTEFMRRTEERNIPVYAWCFKETSNPIDGWLGQDTIEEKKSSIPKQMWEVEYELGEPSIGNRAFDTASVDATFSLPFNPIKRREEKDFWEYLFERPERAGQYVAAADWGKEKDYTVIGVFRLDPTPEHKHPHLVYYLRVNRRPYPMMVGAFNKAIQLYNVPDSGAWHDSTGLGNVVNDLLDSRARGFTMTGEKRDALVSHWVSEVEQHDRSGHGWRIPRIKEMYLEHKYARVGDLYSRATSEYHLPDTVCMAAFAAHAASRFTPSVAPELVRRSDEPTKFAAQFEAHGRSDGLVTAAPTSPAERDASASEISLMV